MRQVRATKHVQLSLLEPDRGGGRNQTCPIFLSGAQLAFCPLVLSPYASLFYLILSRSMLRHAQTKPVHERAPQASTQTLDLSGCKNSCVLLSKGNLPKEWWAPILCSKLYIMSAKYRIPNPLKLLWKNSNPTRPLGYSTFVGAEHRASCLFRTRSLSRVQNAACQLKRSECNKK